MHLYSSKQKKQQVTDKGIYHKRILQLYITATDYILRCCQVQMEKIYRFHTTKAYGNAEFSTHLSNPQEQLYYLGLFWSYWFPERKTRVLYSKIETKIKNVQMTITYFYNPNG